MTLGLALSFERCADIPSYRTPAAAAAADRLAATAAPTPAPAAAADTYT